MSQTSASPAVGPSRLPDDDDVSQGHDDGVHEHRPSQQSQPLHQDGAVSPVRFSNAPLQHHECLTRKMLMESPPSPEDIELAPHVHDRLSTGPKGPHHSNSGSAKDSAGHAHETSSAMEKNSRSRRSTSHASTVAGLATRDHDASSGVAEAAAPLRKQQHPQSRCRQSRAVTDSGGGAVNRRRGRNARSLPPFAKVPTTAAMGAAVAARAQKSVLNPSTALRAPSSTKPPQPVLPNSPATGNMTAFCSPTNVMPVSSSNNRTREGSSDSVMRDPRTPHFHGEGSSPVALPGARTSVEVDHPPLPTPLLSGNNNNSSSSSTLTTNALRTRTGIDKKVAAASRTLTREVPSEDPLTQPLLPESIKTATPPAASASVGSEAPGNSSSALNRFALPQLQTEEAGHSLGLLRVLPTPTSAETVRLGGEALGSASANTKKPEVGIAVTDAAPQQEQQQRSTVTAQPERVDDDCSDTLDVVSFASVGDRRIYSLAHSTQTSGITCTLTNATPHKGTTAAVAAAAAVDQAFISTEPRMEPPHQLLDSLAHSGGDNALADGVPTDSPQYCFAGSAQSIPRSPTTYCMSTSASAAASMAAIGITRSTPALCPLGAGQPRRRRMTVATRAEEEAFLRQSIEAGEGAVAEPANRAAMLTCSSTAPSYVASMTSVTVSDGVGVSSMAGHSQSPGPQQHTNDPIDPLGAGSAQSQRVNSVTNNFHWGLGSTNMRTFSNGSIAGAAGVAPILHERSVLGNSVNNNNSSVLLSGSLLTAGGASMRSSFNASIFTQQNKSALVSELKLRRQRLHKQLGVLQKEATARNIFALVRASNASQLQYLLQVGLCSVNDRDYNGCTPLHVAAGEGNQTIVHVLLSFGADVVAVDYSGRTPLDCAAANRHSGVAHYLLTVIRNKHFNNDSGAGGGATSSRGDDGPCASILGAEQTTEDGSVATEVYPSRSNSAAWGAAPLGVSPADAPASSSTLWTATSTTQSSTPAQQHHELLESSPTLLLPLRRQHRQQQQQQQHWVSCSTVASTPSPSIPENFDPNPSIDAALGHATDGANWSEGDTSPHVPGRGVDAVPAVTAASDMAVAVSAPPFTTSKPLHSSLASGSICGPASRWMLPQSTGPQNSAPQEGSEAMGKSRGANSSLTRHESFMPMSASRWRHNNIPHGSSPQRPVFLSSLDSTAAAHSRGLIAAESNAGSASTVPFSACSSSSPSRPSTFVSGVRSPASQPMAPPPSAVSIGEPTTSFGNSSAGGDDDAHRRPVVSAPPYLAGGVEECVSYETRLSTTQRPSSQTSTAMSLTQTTATAAAATREKWHHNEEESLADPDVDGIVHNPQGRPHPLQDEASTSFLGGFSSASSGFMWSSTPRSPTTRKDLRHNRKDRNNFKETGSFPGEMPTNLPTHPMRAAATSATTAAMFTSGTVATASGGGAQHRPMLLRSSKRPQNRFSATESRREALDTEKDAPPTRMLHPLMLLTGDTRDRSNGDRGGSDPVLTTTTLTTASTIGTTPVTPMVGGAHKSLEDLTGSMAGSGAGSLRDMGQQSLEEHHHHFRMTAGGMRINMRQSKVKFDLDRYSAPLAETRDVFEPTTTEAAVTRLSVPSGGSSERRSSTVTTDHHHHHHVAQHISHPAAAALSTPWSTGATSDALAPANPANASRRPVNALGATPEKAGAPTTAERPPAEKQLCLGEVQDEPADLSALDHSSYTTVSDTVSMIVCMVGLPGRGKSFISKRLVRYMNWKGVPCKVFNAGNYRRHLLGVEGTAGADFFDPNNPQGAQLRERMAELACEDLVKFIASYSLAVGILDATNTTRKRRAWLSDYFQREAQRHALPYRLLFIESVCTDDAIVMENILRSKCDNDDFKNVKDVGTVIAEFRNRILNYEKVYETLEPEERMPYIKIINIKHHVILHRVQNGLGSRIAFFLMNLHPIAFPIYVALPGETVGDSQHVYGGEERLTARGEAYAIALKNFIQDRYVPHMVVLHATNYCVLSTLAPLMDGAMEEEGAHFLQAVGNANGHGVSGGRALSTFKAPTHAPQQQATATKSSAALVDPVGTTGREASMSQAPNEVLELPSSMYNVVPAPEGSEQDTLVPSADGPPCRLQPHSPAVSVTATPPDAASYHSTGSAVPDTNKAMNRDDVDHAEVPPAAQLRDSYDGGVTAVNGHPSSVAAAVAEFTRDDDSGEEEVADDVLCPVPGLDNINFGRFSGHTAAWVSKRYPRLSTLLYDMDDGDMAGDAKAEAAAATATAAAADRQEQPESLETRSLADTTASLKLPGPVKATGSAPHNNPDPRSKSFPAVGQSSAPLPPPMHYATHEEAIAHLQRAPDGVDPRLAYGIPLPNGESFRQVNVRLEPALMAIMRSQSPVFVVAPAVPAQGVLSFFMDLIPELSPTIRIPKGCVVEVGVKDSITVHPLLPDSLPEKMTRSPLTVLPEIQEAIREVGDLQLPGEQQGKYTR